MDTIDIGQFCFILCTITRFGGTMETFTKIAMFPKRLRK